MYLPDYFRPSDADVAELLASMGAGELVTATGAGILATMLPLIWEPADGSADGRGRLMGHLARKNRQWQEPALGEALVIVRGPDAYISPAWYETKREHGRVVPTWNYVTAHLHGRLVIHDDPACCERNGGPLVERHERGRPEPWSVDDAPPPYIDGQLRAIVGVEVIVSRIEAKSKLSQNRSAADVLGAIAGLEAVGDPDSLATAAVMRRAEDEQARER